jgi:hypothetical protein
MFSQHVDWNPNGSAERAAGGGNGNGEGGGGGGGGGGRAAGRIAELAAKAAQSARLWRMANSMKGPKAALTE